jgi:hypothetical protein
MKPIVKLTLAALALVSTTACAGTNYKAQGLTAAEIAQRDAGKQVDVNVQDTYAAAKGASQGKGDGSKAPQFRYLFPDAPERYIPLGGE